MSMPALKKRIMSFLLAAILLLACSPAAQAETDSPTEPETAEAATAPTQPSPEPESTEAATIPTEVPSEPTEFPTEPEPSQVPSESTEPPTELPEMLPIRTTDTEEPLGPGLYFGQLHGHTGLSGDTGSAEEAFAWASQVKGLDFFALTDHSNALDPEIWAAGKAAAEAVTTSNFVGIFGYEMSWPRMHQLGHITAFATPGFESWEDSRFSSADTGLQNYCSTLSAIPGAIGQFCHPGTDYGTFRDFSHYSESNDTVMHLLEVFWGEGPETASGYDTYVQALDKGWHLAPAAGQGNFSGNWGSANGLRTVVYAETLTENGIYDALRSRRVYATQDPDLEVYYRLSGHFMGSRLKPCQAGDTAEVSVSLYDPTDTIGLVEVVTEGGAIAASSQVNSHSQRLNISLPLENRYYFLKITQPDGDIAVTAPVWIDLEERLGISGLTCNTDIPAQHQPTALTLSLYNQETIPFLVDTIEVFADGNPLLRDTSTKILPPDSTLDQALTITWENVGITQITVRLTGMLEGSPRSYETAVTLNFRRSDQVTDILMDASHGNACLDTLSRLGLLASEEDIRLTLLKEQPAPQALKACRILIVTAPNVPFSQDFLSAAAEFASYGGSILVCGRSAASDAGISSAAELNRLMEAVGSSLRIQADSLDPILTSGINTASPWCQGIAPGQCYRQDNGCSVDAGSGTWLVQDAQTSAILLARESLPAGGTLFAAGAFPFGDAVLAESKNLWDLPYANRTLLNTLLNIGGETVPLSTIRQARDSDADTLVRIRGYVTAGTANPHNTFPDTLYLQDKTGGIAVIPFAESGIAVGTPLEIVGTVQRSGRNPELKYSSHKVLEGFPHRYPGKTGSWDSLLDPAVNGGMLVEVQGICQDTLLRPDGTLMRCTLMDKDGRTIQLLVEDGIGSLATGENNLHKSLRRGRTVRAIGILHTDDEGIPVIRVRNCEEVVYVPPRAAANPATADPLLSLFCLNQRSLIP